MEWNTKIVIDFFEYTNIKNNWIEYRYWCLYCNEIYQKTFDENVKKRFANTYKFANHDINKFILLLGRSVYLYEYMDDWEKFIEILLPEKEDFYSPVT